MPKEDVPEAEVTGTFGGPILPIKDPVKVPDQVFLSNDRPIEDVIVTISADDRPIKPMGSKTYSTAIDDKSDAASLSKKPTLASKETKFSDKIAEL